jgi:hypothetical protein
MNCGNNATLTTLKGLIMKSSKVETVVTNGVDGETLATQYNQDGAILGEVLEAQHTQSGTKITGAAVEHLEKLFGLKINRQAVMRAFFDGIERTAPIFWKADKRAKQTKSDCLTICKALDKGAKIRKAGLNAMVKNAREFLNPKPVQTEAVEGTESPKPAEAVTPKANNEKSAYEGLQKRLFEAFAYGEKNAAMLPQAIVFALKESHADWLETFEACPFVSGDE